MLVAFIECPKCGTGPSVLLSVNTPMEFKIRLLCKCGHVEAEAPFGSEIIELEKYWNDKIIKFTGNNNKNMPYYEIDSESQALIERLIISGKYGVYGEDWVDN